MGPAPWSSPPDPAHLQQIAAARQASVKIRRAAGMAVFSGWCTAVFAFLTLLFGAASVSVLGSMLGLGMGAAAIFEIRGAGQLKRLDPTAPRRLAINQLFFGGLLFVYAAISLWTTLHSPSDLLTELSRDPQLREMAEPMLELANMLAIAIYASLMAYALIVPGLTAWYYLSRRKLIEKYLLQTPQWILDLQRAGMSL